MALDLNTLHFCSAVSRCAYVVVFVVIIIGQPRQVHLWLWMGAMVASMTGSFIMMGVPPDALPPIPILMVVHGMYAASLVLCWAGFRTFFGKPVDIRLGALLIGVPSVLFPAAHLAGLSDRLALAAVFTWCMAVAVQGLYEILGGKIGRTGLWSQYIQALAFGFYTVVFFASICMLVFTTMPIASGESARASMIVDQLLGVLVYFGFVAMSAERANRNLLLMAETDPLTGVHNRRGLREALPRAMSQAKRTAIGVLMADIDHFKAINDRYGHESGDLVLIAFAARIRGALRASDCVARWGGEEFLALLPDTKPAELARIAERVRAAIATQPFSLPSGSLSVTVSIGIATMDPDHPDFETTARRADAALYEAKASGRNRVCSAGAIEPALHVVQLAATA